MDDARHTRLLTETAEFIRQNADGILEGWEELMRPVMGESLVNPALRPRALRVLEIIADLLDGEEYDSYSNYMRRVFLDLSTAGYGPSWILQTIELFIEYIAQGVAQKSGADSADSIDIVSAEFRTALETFLKGGTGYRAMRDLAVVAESLAKEVSEYSDVACNERELLLRITGAFHSVMSKRDIFSDLLPVLAELIPAAQASAVMLFDEAQVLRLAEVHNLDDFQPVKSEVNLDGTIYNDIILHGEERILDRSRLSEKVDLIFRRASTVGEKVLRAPPLSVAVIPIHAEKRPIGGLALFNYSREGSFQAPDLGLLKVLTQQLTLVLERVLYFERAGRQHRRIKTILEMAESVKHGQPPREVAEVILGLVRRAIDFTRGMIFHLSGDGSIIPTGAIDIEAPLDVRGLDVPDKPEPMLVLALQRREIIHIEDLASPNVFSSAELPIPVKGVENGSLIIAPLAIDQEPVGLLLMYHSIPHAFDNEEIDLIRVICQQTAHFMRRALDYERYVKDQAIQNEEHVLAQRMQSALFSRSFRFNDLEVQASLIQAEQLAGDFAVIRPARDGFMLAVGDVSGRGHPAGLIMMRAYGLVQETFLACGDPGHTLSEVNRIFCRQLEMPAKRFSHHSFVNCSIAVAGSKGKINLSSAGTPPPFLFIASTGDVITIRDSGIPLGINPDVEYKTSELTLSPGDKLLLYTDGLVMGEEISGKPFGLEELKALFAKCGRFPSRVILDLIEGALKEEPGNSKLGDDQTAAIIAADDLNLKRLSFKGDDEEREAACDTVLKGVQRRANDRDLIFAARLALHEIVKNAIEHGNRGDTSLKVHLTYLIGEDFIHIAVRDSGTGFDPAILKSGMGSAAILKDKGRGFLMVKQLMDRVWYEPAAGEINLFTRFPITEA